MLIIFNLLTNLLSMYTKYVMFLLCCYVFFKVTKSLRPTLMLSLVAVKRTAKAP